MEKTKTDRELQFENDYVSIWKMVALPTQPLEFDDPLRGKIVVPLQAVEGQFSKPYWVTPQEKIHFNYPTEVMVIEMKQVVDQPLPSIPLE